jgi:hypothetical protein
MDKKILVETNIEEGKKLVDALDRSKFTLSGALWFYYSKVDEWRLLLVSPLVDVIGPRKAYTIIQNVIEDLRPVSISIIDISVLSPKNSLVQLLRIAIRTDPKAISQIRFTQNTISNVFLEDALIYRLT